MDCIFNDLSFCEVVNSKQEFLCAFADIENFYKIGNQYNHSVYIHVQSLYSTAICGLDFRSAVNSFCDKEKKRKIFILLHATVLSLPENTAIPDGCSFFYNEQEIPHTGLSESAFRIFMEEKSHSFGLCCPNYDFSILPVEIKSGSERDIVEVPNVSNIDTFKGALAAAEPEAQSWDEVLNRARRLPHIQIEDSAVKALARESFEVSLGKSVLRVLQAIEDIASSSGDSYHELTRKYCHGDRAIFSDESETRIATLRDKLFFWVSGERQLCSFHGKIRHRDFRIHMDKQPIPDSIVHIVHIGYKII